jgi:hypothetical protein
VQSQDRESEESHAVIAAQIAAVIDEDAEVLLEVSSGDSGKLSWLTCRLIVVTSKNSATFDGKYVLLQTSIANAVVCS